jgi:serine/threonine-protein kinase HipA
MSGTLVVLFGDTVVGTVIQLPGGRLRFDYDAVYRERSHATPMSLSMPTSVPSHADGVIRPWLWGLLPDNQAVLDRWARQFHVSASSPFGLLATSIGRDCAGAMRFVPPQQVEGALDSPGDVTWLDEQGVGERLRDLRGDPTAWLGKSFTGQFSLAGFQSKTALLFKDGRWGVPSGAVPTTHILKPAQPQFEDSHLNEHLCLAAARRAGLTAVKTRIEQFAGETAIVVERYDRVTESDEPSRVHQEDLCQALGLLPWQKYQSEGGPGPRHIAEFLRNVMAPRAADDAVRRFADALIWNWLIGGTDAHAKNYSLLLAGAQARLAPLYDVASGLPYASHERHLRMAMKIGGNYEIELWQSNWPKAARDLSLDVDQLLHRVRQLASSAPDAFASAAAESAVRALHRPLVPRLVDLIADRSERCLRLLAAPGPTA